MAAEAGPAEPPHGEHAPAPLTPSMASRRLQVLAFVRLYISRYHASPSIGEIAAGAGISRSAAHRIVDQLVREGRLLRARGRRRGIELPSRAMAAVQLLAELGWQIGLVDGTNAGLIRPGRLDYPGAAGETASGGAGHGAAGDGNDSRRRQRSP